MRSKTILSLIMIIFCSNFLTLKSELSEKQLEYRCLTFKPEIKRRFLADRILREEGMDKSERARIADKVRRGEIAQRPEFLDTFFTSASGNFVIHYDTVGIDAVPTEDNDNNGIPDYVDSTAYYYDRAFEIEVNQLGYHSPAVDSGMGGSNAYDIYLIDLGNPIDDIGAYGFTELESEILPRRKYERWTSFIVMDNNFSPLDSFRFQGKVYQTYNTIGITAVKITSAHEFHHAIQFMYGIEDRNGLVHEMTSTWMEYRLYPEIKDYYQYLPGLFRNPMEHPISSGSGMDGYRWSIFHHFMQRRYGDASVRRLWELIESEVSGYASLDSLFKEQESSFAEEWCLFMNWMYHTGSRAVPGEYFNDAADFPELSFHNELTFNPQEVLADSGSLQPYELRALRVFNLGTGAVSDDTLDFVFTNTDTKATIAFLSSNRAYDFYFDDSESPGFIQLPGTDYYYLLEASEDYYCHKTLFYPGGETCSKDFVYPSPFTFSHDEDLFFPAPAKAMLYENVKLCVYTVDMKQIYYGEHPVTVHNNCRVVIWNEIPETISSGVYIYSLEYKGDTKLGKFAVRRL